MVTDTWSFFQVYKLLTGRSSLSVNSFSAFVLWILTVEEAPSHPSGDGWSTSEFLLSAVSSLL